MRIVEAGSETTSVTLYDFEPTPLQICRDVLRSLSERPRKLSPKYFYDSLGARLFEEITELPEYYPTRSEISILRRFAPEMAARIGPAARIVEFGSGSGEKTRILLRHLETPAAYIPVDISRGQLVEFALSVAAAFPALRVTPVCADYSEQFALPPKEGEADRCVAFFPGSTIGNLEPDEAAEFLRRTRALVGPDGALLLGIDLRKEPSSIERAYNDPGGVTAAFNLNLLKRINRQCGADFDLGAFRHRAFFDVAEGRLEMQLVSERRQTVRVAGTVVGEDPAIFEFEAGEPITTEYSYKYELHAFTTLAGRAGWRISDRWLHEENAFAVLLLD